MSTETSKEHTLVFFQHDLHLIFAAYHELDFISYTEAGDMTSEIEAFEQFAQELVRAISDNPDVDPLDAFRVGLDIDRNSLEVTMDERTIRQFFDACMSMEDRFHARVLSEPFDEVVTEQALGRLEL